MTEEQNTTKEARLTLKQEIFCQAWVSNKGNGTPAALEAFDIEGKELLTQNPPKQVLLEEEGKEPKVTNQAEINTYWKKIGQAKNTARSMASENMTKPNILKRIDEILEERGFEDKTVKREHFKLIVNSEDKVKKSAIDSYYKVKGRFVEKVDITTKGEAIQSINYIQPDGDDNTKTNS